MSHAMDARPIGQPDEIGVTADEKRPAFDRRADVRCGPAALRIAPICLAFALATGCTRAPPQNDAAPEVVSAAATSAPSAALATAAPLKTPISLLPVEDPKQTLREGFFVYGFSKTAKLAFVETKVEDGKGETSYRLVIHDLRDDVLVEELAWSTPRVIDATTLEPFLTAQREAVGVLLAKHEIAAQGERREPSFTEGDATLRVVLSGSDEKTLEGEKVRAVVLTKQPGDLEKKIGSVLEKGIAGMPVLYGSRPLAVLVSPFERRAAVLIVTTVRGFEGPPNGRAVTVLGADLERGFAR